MAFRRSSGPWLLLLSCVVYSGCGKDAREPGWTIHGNHGEGGVSGDGSSEQGGAGHSGLCGNELREGAEECDPPDGTLCSYGCEKISLVCGNEITQPGEECDPADGILCDEECQHIPIKCGNEITQPGEKCDPPDGILCDAECWDIPIKCDNGITQPGEECDPPDGILCDQECQDIPVVCGNHIIQSEEECDPPDQIVCSSACENIPIKCGNKIVQPSEECDPPNGTSCTSTCNQSGLINVCPELTWLLVAPLHASAGAQIDLEVDAIDTDGDALSFAWAASGSGTLGTPTSKIARFTCTAPGDYTISVAISDSRGCTVSSDQVAVHCGID